MLKRGEIAAFYGRRRLLIGFVVGLIIGPFLWPSAHKLALQMRGPRDVRCFNGACLGDPTDVALKKLSVISSGKGGLVSVGCGPEGNGEYLYLGNLFTKTCIRSDFIVVIANDSTIVGVTFNAGSVVKIHVDPGSPIEL